MREKRYGQDGAPDLGLFQQCWLVLEHLHMLQERHISKARFVSSCSQICPVCQVFGWWPRTTDLQWKIREGGQALDDNSLVAFAACHEDLRFCLVCSSCYTGTLCVWAGQQLLPVCHLYSLALGENSWAPTSSRAEQGSCWLVVLTTLLIFHGAWTFTNCPGAASAAPSGETMGYDCD